MKKTKTEVKKFKFSKAVEIGSPDAETDRMLMKVFIENDSLESLLEVTSQKSIIIGRTGSGKSALIKFIENSQNRVTRIEPEAMSLRFLSNSTILKYFRGLDVNLNFFYKVLWKHVFMIELLKLYFGEDSFKKQNWIENFKTKLFNNTKKNPRKDRAINYLVNFSGDFWMYTESRIKELEKILENKFEYETGKNISEVIGTSKLELGAKERLLTEYKAKAEKIINEIQAEEIYEIISIMKTDIFNDANKKYYILIDDLDKEWISTEIRYDIISALVEVVKEFQVFEGVKIIIALRDNLHQIIFSGIQHRGGQREKFKPLYLNLEWSKEELSKLLEKRLELISEKSINIRTAFEKQYNNKISGFDYMLDRTFQRPRDVISFVNHTIECTSNKSYFTLDLIKKAEIFYSNDRLQAIEDEWGENYGNIKDLYSFLHAKYNGFKLRNIKEEEFMMLLLGDNPELKYKGELLDIVNKYKVTNKFTTVVKDLIYLLYQIGIIGIKKGATFPLVFYYNKELSISINDINNDCKIYVHKAFYAALSINTKEMEADFY
jgi:hypothetical protein